MLSQVICYVYRSKTNENTSSYHVKKCYGVSLCYSVGPCYGVSLCYAVIVTMCYCVCCVMVLAHVLVYICVMVFPCVMVYFYSVLRSLLRYGFSPCYACEVGAWRSPRLLLINMVPFWIFVVRGALQKNLKFCDTPSP